MENARVVSVTQGYNLLRASAQDLACYYRSSRDGASTQLYNRQEVRAGNCSMAPWLIEMRRYASWFSHVKKAHAASDSQQLFYTPVFFELAP